MFQLTPATRQALDAFCDTLSESQAQAFREVVRRICADPSGRREPRHSYTRPFRNPERYIRRKLPAGTKVWELKTNRYRGLFVTSPPWIAFLEVRGKTFMTADECPWHRWAEQALRHAAALLHPTGSHTVQQRPETAVAQQDTDGPTQRSKAVLGR